eukprot:scaffold2450_cov128-Isochrysis_galbana.AAC.5
MCFKHSDPYPNAHGGASIEAPGHPASRRREKGEEWGGRQEKRGARHEQRLGWGGHDTTG